MSQKISSKNLHYDQTLPPFLARLRAQHNAAVGDGPDPFLAAHRRPAKPRDQADLDEDAPVIVDEEGNVVAAGTMTVGVDGTVTKNAKAVEQEEEEAEEEKGGKREGDKEKEKEGSGMIGGKRKRKVGKIIGADEEDEDKAKTATSTKQTSGDDKKTDAEDKAKKNGGASKGGKKKAKKIKLSFGDDGD